MDAKQAVTTAQIVVQKTEGSALGQGHQPDGKFGQLDCQVVYVDAIETTFGNQTSGNDDSILCISRQRFDYVIGFLDQTVHADQTALCFSSIPCFQQSIGKPAAGLHKKCA